MRQEQQPTFELQVVFYNSQPYQKRDELDALIGDFNQPYVPRVTYYRAVCNYQGQDVITLRGSDLEVLATCAQVVAEEMNGSHPLKPVIVNTIASQQPKYRAA